MRKKQVEKRHKKFLKLQQELPLPNLYGEKSADMTIICWGSTKMVALETMRQLQTEGINTNILHFSYLYPLNWKKVKEALDKCNKTLFVEGNQEGLFEGVLKQYTGFEPTERYHRVDGRPFYPEELVEKVKSIVIAR